MAKRHRLLQRTPVRDSVREFVSYLEHIDINTKRIAEVADDWADDTFELPQWRAPVFPDETDADTTVDDVIDFVFVGNCLNFAFRQFDDGEKFLAEYDGTEYAGAFGMWACLKRAYDEGQRVLDGRYLATLSEADAHDLFRSSNGRKIPLLEDRVRILRSVGTRLTEAYDGRFRTLVTEASPYLFDDGDGIVDRLVAGFPSFDDSSVVTTAGEQQTIHFHKRAQLAPAMAYGRFHGTEAFDIRDPGSFTVFADYNLPNVLRGLGVLEYDSELAEQVDSRTLVEAGSRAEVEIRAATIEASDRLLSELDARRSSAVYAPHLDYKLFTYRDAVSTPPHRTKTPYY
jgi:hypothetical protein